MLVLENTSDGHNILENRKKAFYKYNIMHFLWNTFMLEEKLFGMPPTLSPYENGIECIKDERPSDTINFRCL